MADSTEGALEDYVLVEGVKYVPAPTSVWMLENHRWDSDEHGWEDTIDPDFGYFTDKDAAQTDANKLNARYYERYDKAVYDREKFSEAVMRNNETAQRQWKLLTDAGEDVPTPRVINPNVRPVDFDDFIKIAGGSYYRPLEVKPAPGLTKTNYGWTTTRSES